MSRADAATRHRSIEHWILLAGAFAGLGIVVLFHFFVVPDARGFGTHEQLGLPACKTIEWWGVPCPGCGVTTSVALAAHGRLLAALHNQPLGLAVALTLCAAPLWAAWQHARGRDLLVEGTRLPWKPLVVLACVVIVGAWVWKLGLVERWWC